ncbi:hypothetical protein IMSHALPRED_002862 [Imshaugia aleurites]|uniref:Uncharacterized protein n=1 Tax=Imshaugia aleurites TaxID=172621 RepID=A0A8H3PHY2_9LECA|nr:hypothetical protein IMSHALPRED_002862 [Imshaugia aleurites]
MGSTAPCATGFWPVKPGLNPKAESRLDNRPVLGILSSLQESRPITGERNVWDFWRSGFSNSPPSVQRTVINWIRCLPTWDVRVLDSIPGSPQHCYRYIPPTLPPEALNNNTITSPYVGPHSADLIRPPLLYLNDDFGMEVGALLFRDLDGICWSRLEDPRNPYEMAGSTLLHEGAKANYSFTTASSPRGKATHM